MSSYVSAAVGAYLGLSVYLHYLVLRDYPNVRRAEMLHYMPAILVTLWIAPAVLIVGIVRGAIRFAKGSRRDH